MPDAVRSLDQLVDGFLVHEFSTSPTVATALGVDGYDDRLPDLSAAAIAMRERAEDEWAARFAALTDADLTADECIDRAAGVFVQRALGQARAAIALAERAVLHD